MTPSPSGRSAPSGACPNNALHENTRGNDNLRIERAERYDFTHLGDRACRSSGHDGSEVARRHPVDEIAPAVASVGAYQGKVRPDRHFEDVILAVYGARFLALCEKRTVARRRENGTQSGAGSLDAAGEISLRHQFELDLPLLVQSVEHPGVGLARK